MRITFNFKDDGKLELTEDETKALLKQINYLKLMIYINNPDKLSSRNMNVLNKEINTDDLKSVEFVI